MNSITILVLACAFASGIYMTNDVKYADSTFLVKQKAILEILQHVHQNDVLLKLYDEAKQFKLFDKRDSYTKPEVVDEFKRFYEHGMLGLNEVFSIMDHEHREEVIALFNVFYNAKSWEIFRKTIVWARFYVNKGMFIYALTVAVFHRSDMTGIALPAQYEIYPYYFFNNEVIQHAQNFTMEGIYEIEEVDDLYTVVIPSNYTAYQDDTNPEQKLSYFTEDIGLNSYNYYLHVDYPFWMGGEKYNVSKDRRGEHYIFQRQQFLARYYMERLSNDIGEIPEFSWYEPIETGHYTSLRSYNGDFFPSRDNHYTVYEEQNYYDVDHVEDYERHFRDAIEYGFITLPGGKYSDLTKPESIEWLGNFFQGNPDSNFDRLNGYWELAKSLLGGSTDPFDLYKIPNTLEHFETEIRDTIFYKLSKNLIKYIFQWQKHLPRYTWDELDFKGAKIESVEIDNKLVTYFEKFDSDITNVVDVEMFDYKPNSALQQFGRVAHYDGYDLVVKTRQPRLNHLPFTFTLHVGSDRAQKAIVKVFIGPKFDEYGHIFTYEESRETFFELDHFLVDLVAGKNDIVRKSQDFSSFVEDRITYCELYKQVMLAVKGEIKFPLDMSEARRGFPMRLMLPKGKRGGMMFQFFFIVAPYVAPNVAQNINLLSGLGQTVSNIFGSGSDSGSCYNDNLPFGYPFDRPINERAWLTPNMYYYDVNIFHEEEMGINTLPTK
ncbi:larval serum protein 2-like [Bradysia coprophila]|uniref:larval serum protein 2-like n=1 Tax=Bradysia coprophila TaxID=38358 RepID=UPI00187D8E3E|nr:larval serum protein 2-like [Bradysia coprophila]